MDIIIIKYFTNEAHKTLKTEDESRYEFVESRSLKDHLMGVKRSFKGTRSIRLGRYQMSVIGNGMAI